MRRVRIPDNRCGGARACLAAKVGGQAVHAAGVFAAEDLLLCEEDGEDTDGGGHDLVDADEEHRPLPVLHPRLRVVEVLVDQPNQDGLQGTGVSRLFSSVRLILSPPAAPPIHAYNASTASPARQVALNLN